MSNLKDTDIEDLFRRASEKYPLRTDSADWDRMAAALEKDPPRPPDGEEETDKRRKRRILWLLLLLPLAGAGYYALQGHGHGNAPIVNGTAAASTPAGSEGAGTAGAKPQGDGTTGATEAGSAVPAAGTAVPAAGTGVTKAGTRVTTTGTGVTAAGTGAKTEARARTTTEAGASATPKAGARTTTEAGISVTAKAGTGASTAAGGSGTGAAGNRGNATAVTGQDRDVTTSGKNIQRGNAINGGDGLGNGKAIRGRDGLRDGNATSGGNGSRSGSGVQSGNTVRDGNGLQSRNRVQSGNELQRGNIVSRGNIVPSGGNGLQSGNAVQSGNELRGGNGLQGGNAVRGGNGLQSGDEPWRVQGAQMAFIPRDYFLSVLVKAPEAVKDSGSGPGKKNAKQATTKHFYAGVIGAPDLSTVKMQAVKGTGSTFGLLLGYSLNRRWSIETGVYVDRKRYYTDGEYFSTEKVTLPPNSDLLNVNGVCFMWEIPLNFRYNFNPGGKTAWFATAGFSTYLMSHENYDYAWKWSYGSYVHDSTWKIKQPSQYPFSIINLSVGFEQRLGKVGSLRLEPYARIPLTGMGTGKLPIMSAGVNIGITRQLW